MRSVPKLPKTCLQCGDTFLVQRSSRNANKFCGTDCSRQYVRENGVSFVKKKNGPDEFWAQVDKGDRENDCWIWTGLLSPGGYGWFQCHNRLIKAHRYSWQLSHGAIPKDKQVCHNCPNGDDKRCVNPNHLFLGTVKEHREDTARKGQLRRGDQHPLTTLRSYQVYDARLLYATGLFTYREIAEAYGVGTHVIARAIAGKTWAHIPFPSTIATGRRFGEMTKWETN